MSDGGAEYTEDIDPPTGPFVWWGRQVGRVCAPRAGLGAADRIGLMIMMGHILAGGIIAYLVTGWAFVPLFVLGLLSGGRYAANCHARQKQMLRQLKEENPDMDVVDV